MSPTPTQAWAMSVRDRLITAIDWFMLVAFNVGIKRINRGGPKGSVCQRCGAALCDLMPKEGG